VFTRACHLSLLHSQLNPLCALTSYFCFLWCILIITCVVLYQFLCSINMLMEGLTHYSERDSGIILAVSKHMSKVNIVMPNTVLSGWYIVVLAVQGVNRNC
jgi:hypothetical protein